MKAMPRLWSTGDRLIRPAGLSPRTANHISAANGKATNGTTLPEAVEQHGGHWFNNSGSNVIKAQLEQLQQFKQMQAAIAQMEAQRQLAIANLRAEADAAEKQFILAMASSDYEGAAAACRRMTRAEAQLVYLSTCS